MYGHVLAILQVSLQTYDRDATPHAQRDGGLVCENMFDGRRNHCEPSSRPIRLLSCMSIYNIWSKNIGTFSTFVNDNLRFINRSRPMQNAYPYAPSKQCSP